MRLPELDRLRATPSAAVPEANRAGRETSISAASSAGTPQGDAFQLSGLAERISGSLPPMAADHQIRVENLSQEYQSGTYIVQPLAVSRALISHALLQGAV